MVVPSASIPSPSQCQEAHPPGYLSSWVSSLESRLERFKHDHTEQFQGLLRKCCMLGERVVSLQRFDAIYARIGSLKSYVEGKFRELRFSLSRVQREVQDIQSTVATNTKEVAVLEDRTSAIESELHKTSEVVQGQIDDMQIAIDGNEGQIEKVGVHCIAVEQRVEKLENKSCNCVKEFENRILEKMTSMEIQIMSRMDSFDQRLDRLEGSLNALTKKMEQ